MKKLLLTLFLIPNFVIGETQLDKKGIMCESGFFGGNTEFNLWCIKNKCVEYDIYGYKVLIKDKWSAYFSGSTRIIFTNSRNSDKLNLDRESLKLEGYQTPTYNCKVVLKNSDITDHLYKKINKSKKENKI